MVSGDSEKGSGVGSWNQEFEVSKSKLREWFIENLPVFLLVTFEEEMQSELGWELEKEEIFLTFAWWDESFTFLKN